MVARITTPGKFQGEPYYVEEFYEQGMMGFADDDIDGVWVFNITQEDNNQFPELPTGSKLFLEESDNGFIYSKVEE